MTRLSECFRRDLRLQVSDVGTMLRPVIFFGLVGVVFVLGLGSEEQRLAGAAPGIVWAVMVLAVLLAVEGLFRDDLLDGTLDAWLLSDLPLSLTVLSRVMSLWLTSVVPVVLVAPVFALSLGLPASSWVLATLTLALGSLTTLLFAALGAALVAPVQAASGLNGLLVLPLIVPTLVFGSGGLAAHTLGIDVMGQVALLAAFCVAALSVVPVLIAYALRVVTGG